jgi:RNA-directed DNA polymerase
MADATKTDLSKGTASRRPVMAPALSDDLLGRVLTPENRRKAWHQVKTNPGAPGVEGMTSEAFPAWAREHWPSSRQALRDETYQPAPVRRTEIPKRHGQGKRVLGIPPVVARVIPQAMAQVLGPIFAPGFSASSCGFRPGRSAPQAGKQLQSYSKTGYRVAVDLALAKFFDRVNHDALMARMARRVQDKAVLRLLGK